MVSLKCKECKKEERIRKGGEKEEKEFLRGGRKHLKGEIPRTRPDTRPIPVADGWAGAEMRVFALSNSIITDGRTDGWTNGQTDGQSLL